MGYINRTKQRHEQLVIVDWISNNRLAEYLNKARLVTNPMFTETGPLFRFEAMALFIPVLATRVRNIRDVI